jgi:LmeA-like phospholipid-binding
MFRLTRQNCEVTNPQGAPYHTVWARPGDHMPPPGQPGYGPPPGGPTPKGSKPSPISLRGPLSIVLIAVIVVSLVAGGLLAAELSARHTADSRVAASAECVVGDKVTVSFGLKPLLLQHMTRDYGPISIITAGNQIRGANGMKAEVEIDNVHLDGNDPSKGTIGVLDAAVTWPSNGVTRSVQDAIPLLSSFVSGARTHPSDGTIELRGALGSSIIVKPKVVNNAISL